MGRNAVETVLGAAVILVAAAFVYIVYNTADVKAVSGYQVHAAFYKVGGLTKGSDVRISGIKVGSVVHSKLDNTTFDAVVTLIIKPEIKLPIDTVAVIASGGLMGDKYVSLVPGNETAVIAAGGQLTKTKDFRSLEDQVGEIIFLATGGDDK